MAVFEPTIKRAVEWLESQPHGADTDAVRSALGLTYMHTSGALGQAAKRGLIRWVYEPKGKAHNRRLYFALSLAPAVCGEASKKKLPKHVQIPQKHQRMTGLGKSEKSVAPPTGPVVMPKGLVPVVGPSFCGSRFKVTGDVPRVVDSAQARPWAVAAADALVRKGQA